MSIIQVEDVAFVRFSAPDLDAMEEFLLEFGLARAARTADALYMRGTGGEPYCHATRRDAPGFGGVAFRAASPADLGTLARAEGVAVAPLEGPGGGQIVTLRDPDGHAVEIVAGRRDRGRARVPDQ